MTIIAGRSAESSTRGFERSERLLVSDRIHGDSGHTHQVEEVSASSPDAVEDDDGAEELLYHVVKTCSLGIRPIRLIMSSSHSPDIRKIQ